MSDVDEAWHGEIADKDPTLYAIIDTAGLSHGKSMKSYLIMMAVRLLEMQRILKPTGSLYLHCDSTAGHYLKTMADGIFGTGKIFGMRLSGRELRPTVTAKHGAVFQIRFCFTQKTKASPGMSPILLILTNTLIRNTSMLMVMGGVTCWII